MILEFAGYTFEMECRKISLTYFLGEKAQVLYELLSGLNDDFGERGLALAIAINVKDTASK